MIDDDLCPHGRTKGAVCTECSEEFYSQSGSLYPSREDVINSPQHYKVGGYEAIDVIKAKLTPEEYRGYCKGATLKYLLRANYKNHHDQDCEKAEWYAKELVKACQDAK